MEQLLSVHDAYMRPLDPMPHEGAVLYNQGLLSKKHLAVVVVTTSLEQRVQCHCYSTQEHHAQHTERQRHLRWGQTECPVTLR